jgi:hypothetical protein
VAAQASFSPSARTALLQHAAELSATGHVRPIEATQLAACFPLVATTALTSMSQKRGEPLSPGR